MDELQQWQNTASNFFSWLNKIQKAYSSSLDAFSATDVLAQSAYWGNLYQQFINRIIENPQNILQLQEHYWEHCYQLWSKSWGFLQQESTTEQRSESDKRFADEMWQQHPIFNFIKEYYLLTANHIKETLTAMEGIDPNTAHKVMFFTKQMLDALSPTNFILTNPQVLRTTIETRGINLLEGFQRLLTDLEQHHGKLQIQMTDLKAFAIGKNLAVTPGKVIYQNKLMQLIQYSPQTETVFAKPVLIIPPWINKYYILDLSPENSFVNWLVQQGHTVFMISWINPDEKYAHEDFADYLFAGPLTAIKIIKEVTDSDQVNAIGYCLGGTLLACAAAYLAARHDQSLNSLTYFATLLDFSEPGELGVFIDENQISLLEQQMWQKGFLDGNTLAITFNTLRANDLIWSYFVKNYLQAEEPAPLDVLYWNSDATNMPAQMHSFYLRNFYLHNNLIKPNHLEFAGVPINLQNITAPTFFIAAAQDHIAPWQSIYAAINSHGGNKQFILSGSGHIAGIINPPQKNKYHYQINDNLMPNAQAWQDSAQKHPGSWWPHWENWLQPFSGEKIPARIPGAHTAIIEDAPGTYVKKMI